MNDRYDLDAVEYDERLDETQLLNEDGFDAGEEPDGAWVDRYESMADWFAVASDVERDAHRSWVQQWRAGAA